jgi:hypothetical protein
MDLITTMNQHRVYREISLYVGIRNGLMCTSKEHLIYPHYVFYTRLPDNLIYDMSHVFTNRRRERLPPFYKIPLIRQRAQLTIPDAVYAPRRLAEYELYG